MHAFIRLGCHVNIFNHIPRISVLIVPRHLLQLILITLVLLLRLALLFVRVALLRQQLFYYILQAFFEVLKRCLDMLDVGVLLEHSDLVLYHEAVDVCALLKEPRAQILAILVLHSDQDVEDQVEKDVSVLDLTHF